MNDVFLDTAFAIALTVATDQHHAEAENLANVLSKSGARMITTRAVVLEIGNALARLRYRISALTLLDALEHDPRVDILPISEELFARAFRLYCQCRDKEWSLTDCLSFVVMRDRGLSEALTTDTHFQQAGFKVLLGA
ncbi:MAG: type II toxin-antitoxin system VapC family toxin [Candidatus Hydrogenedentes bacterium]|nr:type II toxin-antitoxin system VapC family toxin [Candidatus Hydrogenedentota bacterium]